MQHRGRRAGLAGDVTELRRGAVTVRAFLAAPVTEPALRECAQLLSRLRSSVAGVRWVRDDGMHLTVHFFGSVTPERVEDAVAAVTPVATAAAPFDLRLQGLGAFPSHGVPRVLWMGVGDGGDTLAAIAGDCTAALAGAGFATEDRPFSPHCTLGRPRRPLDIDSRRAWEAEAGTVLSRCTVDRLVVYESVPSPGGAVHTPLIRIPLGR